MLYLFNYIKHICYSNLLLHIVKRVNGINLLYLCVESIM